MREARESDRWTEGVRASGEKRRRVREEKRVSKSEESD
jgi:hypothetical protein